MTNENALIGFSGFVGNTLLKQASFQNLYRSTNISDIQNKSFDTVVCAGAPAVKWMANKEPEQDKHSIQSLISHLTTVKCKKFILISTVDVFTDPIKSVESTAIETSNLNPYGLHRYQLEEFVRNNFDTHLIVRLPGLVGPGLKKNIIYDFLNQNNLDAIDSRGVFQFYPMVNLWSDIQIALDHKIPLIHLTSEPITVEEVANHCFNLEFKQQTVAKPAIYDFRTECGQIYGVSNAYQYSKKEILLAIRCYAQSESKKTSSQ